MTTEIKFSDHESTFSLSFSSFYRLFSAKANFFLQIFFCFSIFFFFSRGNKQILVSRGRVQYRFCPEGWAFLSLGRIFVLRDGPFEFFWRTKNEVWVNQKNSKGPSRRTKILPRDNKAQPEGQKNNIVPSQGTPKFVCFLEMKKRKNLSSKNNFEKKLALAEKSLQKYEKDNEKVDSWSEKFISGVVSFFTVTTSYY